MSINMSYCRFQNTLSALIECRDALTDHYCGDPVAELSEEEQTAARRLFKLCHELAEFSDDIN